MNNFGSDFKAEQHMVNPGRKWFSSCDPLDLQIRYKYNLSRKKELIFLFKKRLLKYIDTFSTGLFSLWVLHKEIEFLVTFLPKSLYRVIYVIIMFMGQIFSCLWYGRNSTRKVLFAQYWIQLQNLLLKDSMETKVHMARQKKSGKTMKDWSTGDS